MILATSDSFPSAGGGSERRRCAGSPRSAGERRSVSLALVLLAVVLTAASCGSSDDGDSSPSTPPRSVAQAQGVVFTHEVIDAEPPSGSECCLDVVTAGDVDGDGDADVIVGAEHADGLSWYQNPGAPPSVTEWPRFIIGAGDFTTDGLAGDLDRDGDLDVAVSSIDRNVVEWWEQIGDPSTTDGWARHEIGPDFAHDLLLADIDSDGKLDVGAFHSAAGRVAWYRQPDDPTGAWTGHEVDSIDGEGIAAGDLDGDGDTDLVAGPAVYSNDDGDGTAWTRQPLGEDWPEQIRARVADIDEDDVLDIVLVADETEGRLSWLRGPDWAETTIDDDAGYSHSLEVGDVDLDGHLDLLVGVMHGAENPEVRVLFGDGGGDWGETVLSTSGTHNARLVDLDGNGLLDVVGKNFDGPKQVESWWAHPVEAAVEAARPAADAAVPTPLDGFTSVVVDDGREGFNDSTAFFGLTFADLDGDSDDDIESGSYVYLNPGSDLTAQWERIELTEQVGAVVDVMLATDVDGDDQADLIATALPDVWWLEAEEGAATWTGTIVAEVPATSRPNGQGYRLGDLTGDGRPEIVLSGGESESDVWYVQVPETPEATSWPSTRITSTATDEQIGIADIDGDGLNDVAAGDMKDGGSYIAWFQNPGDGSSDWIRNRLGDFPGVYPDRLDVADVDGDSRVDVVVTEENDGSSPNAEVMWYQQPDDPATAEWERRVVVEQFTTNGLDVADFDGDGDLDLVTGEHRGTKQVSIWENAGPDGVDRS